jgi:hypothetical protein
MMSSPLRSVLLLFALALGPTAARAEFPTRIKTEGSLVLAQPGVLTTRSDGRVYQVKIKPETAVEITGKLPVEQLKNGTIVRLTGPLKGAEFEEKIKEIKVHTAADGYQQGVLQDSEEELPTLIGQVLSLRNGTLTVLAARKRYTATLAEDVAVLVETKDYRIAGRGDTIHFQGYLSPDKINVNAQKIEITLKASDSNLRRRE